jgi:hypothetical protein
MRRTNLSEQERSGVLKRHIVETTERVTSYHTVWGGTKKAAKEAVDSGDVMPDDDHRDYDVPTQAKVTRTEQWIACKNYGKMTGRTTRGFDGKSRTVAHRLCQDLIQVPTRTIRGNQRFSPMMPEERMEWIDANKGVLLCAVCLSREADERFSEVVE